MSNDNNKRHFHNITILVDNDSWILPYANELADDLAIDHHCQLVRNADDIETGDVCFLLGCTKIVAKELLARNQYNLVVHESELPQGKGFAPMSWQILAGKKSIPVCLISASEQVDSGKIWLRDIIVLDGNELHDQWRAKQGDTTIKLAKKFVENYQELTANEQVGQTSTYPRRSAKDSELDINKTLAEQFNLLRVVSNKNYPAFFVKDGIKYKVEVSRDE